MSVSWTHRTLRRLLWAFVAVCAGPGTVGRICPAAPLPAGEHYKASIATPRNYEGAPAGGPWLLWSHTLDHPGATYIAIHFTDFDLPPGDYLEICDGRGGQCYRLEGRGKADAGTFWARHIKGPVAVLQLYGTHPSGGGGFSIDEYVAGTLDLGSPPPGVTFAGEKPDPDKIAPPASPEPMANCGPNDRRNAICYVNSHPVEYHNSRAVARLLVNGSGLCTGWLASPEGYLITNAHCVASEYDAINTDYEFMTEAPACELINCMMCFPGVVYSGAVLVRKSDELDYTLVRFPGANPAEVYGYLKIANRPPVVGEQIYIPQHAAGRARELALHSTAPADTGGVCRIYSINEPSCTGSQRYDDVGYFADTEGGSSGSPVIATADHRVIALHHCANCPNRGVPMTLICQDMPGSMCAYSQAALQVNKPAYSCMDTLRITLWDADLIGQHEVPLLVMVKGGDEQVVTLREIQNNSGAYQAALPIVGSSNPVSGDDVLQVEDGQQIHLTYVDEDQGDGTAAMLSHVLPVDCRPPVVSDIVVGDIRSTSVTISFRTSEPTTTRLRYGSACGEWLSTLSNTTLRTEHLYVVTGLEPLTTYAFAIQATDTAGNQTIADDGGNCHFFTTADLPSDYFTQLFGATPNNLAYHAILFTPVPSPNFYHACTQSISRLPTTPSSLESSRVALSDDSYAEVRILGGRRVLLYGQAFDTVYLGSNGYVTMLEPDTGYTETYRAHFQVPRVSALFDDLDPGTGGTVRREQLADRMVFTWQNVPEYQKISSNTFQIEMFFDGRIRISWLELSADDGLVGLSGGLGVPPNFGSGSNLRGYVCPAPPRLSAVQSRLRHGTAGDFDLDLMARFGGCGVGVDSRAGGLRRLLFTFDAPLTPFSHGEPAAVQAVPGRIDSIHVQGSSMIVEMSQVPDTGRVTLLFPGLGGPGGSFVTESLCVGRLIGDVNRDCRVDLLDLVSCRGLLGQPVTPGTAALDAYPDGINNIYDLIMVRNYLQTAINPASCP